MKGRLLVAGAACLWGFWSICFKTAERLAGPRGISAAAETFVVMVVIAVVLAPLALRQRGVGRRPRHWALLFSLGITDALNALCFFLAMQRTTLAVAVLTHYLTPLLVALLAPFIVGERWRARTFAALACALLGLVLLLQPWSSTSSSMDLSGPGLGALSAVFYAANVFQAKGLGGRFSVMEMATWPKLTSLPVLAIAIALGGGAQELAIDAAPLAVLVVGGLVCGTVPLVMFYRGLSLTPASQASVLTLVEPLVAVLVGVLVWGEVPGPWAALGGLLILVGAAVIATSPGTSAEIKPGAT